jgi:hypothetical protein
MAIGKHKALYEKLKEEGFYTKSYDEFVKQFSNPEKIVRLHALMKQDGLYSRTADDFKNQFFPPITPTEKEEMGIISVKDTRKKDQVTGLDMTETNRLDANIDTAMAKHIIKKAKEYNIDPYTALSIAYQETQFKDEYLDNPFSLLSGERLNPDTADADFIDLSMQTLQDKQKLAQRLGKKTEADVIQAWNGYGKIDNESFGRKINKVYGIDVSKQPIDMSKNPVYGKRVLDIRENILKKNPEIVKLVEDIK